MAHILVLYNQPLLPPDHPETDSEAEVLFTVEHVCKELNSRGHRVSQAGVGRDPVALVEQVRRIAPEVVFNLFEGIPASEEGNHGDTETCAAGLLEWLGLTYTGSPARVLALARDKPMSKLILQGAGLPTPDFLVVQSADDERLLGPPLRFPLIVKLTDQDASVGIDQGSVVTTVPALLARVGWLLERFPGPVLVEEYIAGRELTVGIVDVPATGGLQTLSPSEFEFLDAGGDWPIVTYDAKWKTRSEDYARTPYREVAAVIPELSGELSRLALTCYRVLGLRDYGRVDFRVSPEGRPYILEVNPNPDLSPTAGLAGALEAVGLSYTALVNGLVERALSRRVGRGGVS